MDYRVKAHSVYLMTYHVVFVTKYRQPCISPEIGDFMKTRAAELMKNCHGSVISAETDTDHIHLLIEAPPQERPSDIVRVLKTQLSRDVHRIPKYDSYVNQFFSGNTPLWNPSYFMTTAGSPVTEVTEKVRQFIEAQKTDDHHRKYVYSGKYKKSGRGRRKTGKAENP